MAGRRRPLRAVSVVFAGFVTLIVLAQLSVHFFADAIPKHLVSENEAVLASIQRTSTELAFVSGALGLVFAGAVLIITRPRVAADIDIYRATGLPALSAYARVVRSDSVRPLEWVVLATALTALVDAHFGLDALLPVGLAVAFAALMLAWLAFLTYVSFSHAAFEGGGGRSG